MCVCVTTYTLVLASVEIPSIRSAVPMASIRCVNLKTRRTRRPLKP